MSEYYHIVKWFSPATYIKLVINPFHSINQLSEKCIYWSHFCFDTSFTQSKVYCTRILLIYFSTYKFMISISSWDAISSDWLFFNNWQLLTELNWIAFLSYTEQPITTLHTIINSSSCQINIVRIAMINSFIQQQKSRKKPMKC